MDEKEKICLVITGKQYPPDVTEYADPAACAGNAVAAAEPLVTVQEVWASCHEKDGTWYLFYEEQPEGFAQPVRTRVKHKGRCLEVNRQGNGGHTMVFEPGVNYRTAYPTPYGTLYLEIETEAVERIERESGMPDFCVRYTLSEQGTPMGNYELHICRKNG